MTAEEQKKMQELEAENAALKERLLVAQRTLAKYAQMLFGQKTERCRLPEKPGELTGSLFGQEMDPAEQARLDREAEKALAEQDRLIHVEAHDRKVRKAIDTGRLEVKEEHLYPDLDNKEDYTEMAPEVTDSLVLVPRQMYIRRIIRHKFVLKSNLQVADPDRKAFRIAALPPAPLHKCMADASLLADIVISKYVYHLPFYRVMETYKELGVSISASTINDWFKAVVGKVKPIYDLLRAHVLACDYVQVDESTLPVIDNERHRAVKGYVWSVVNVMTGDRFFFYEHGSRSTRVAMGLLKDLTGAIQSDGYIVYEHFEGRSSWAAGPTQGAGSSRPRWRMRSWRLKPCPTSGGSMMWKRKRMLLTRQTTNPTMSAGRPCGRKRLIRKSRSSRRGWRQASSSALRSL